MTHQAPPSSPPAGADPGRQIAQLREILRLVRTIAGEAEAESRRETLLDEAATISDRYDRSLPVVQRRFDALAGEASSWAAAGVEALLAAESGQGGSPRAAASLLAKQLDRALAEMARLLR